MVDGIDKQELAQNYGFALSFFKSNDELWKLFNQAVKQTWTADRFIARLRGTDWFKKHSAAVRNDILQQAADPATYQAQLEALTSHVRDAVGKMFGADIIGNGQIEAWAQRAKRLGWTDEQLLDHITQGVNYKKALRSKQLGGTAADTEAQLRALAQAYGVDLGGQWRTNNVARILKGNDTIEGVRSRVQEVAMREYKAFADSLAGGQTMQDIADPYIQKMASLLEMNPADINLSNKTIQKALKQRTADGKPAAMDLTDFADLVRKDSRWQYTDNAREEVSGVVAQLAQAFGTLA